MKALLAIVLIIVAASIGVFCASKMAVMQYTSGPRDERLVRRFLLYLWLLISCFGVVTVLTSESYREWIIFPFLAASLFLLFRFRFLRRIARTEEAQWS
jgi:cell division protein FtsW (lipid II flippase)